MSEEQQRYERARSRARALRKFYTHAGVYVMVNAILFVVNAGGKVVALGKLAGAEGDTDTPPRTAMILVEWPSREAFQEFLDDPDHRDLHPLREGGTRNYLWWLYERLEDLRPLFREP